MSLLKRVTAFLTAFGMAASLAACGSNTTQALTVDGYQVPAGVYIYYVNTAYNTALSQLAEENPDLDTTDTEAVKASSLEGKDIITWIQDKATEMVVDFVATEQKFDELGLELTADDKSNISMMQDYYWSSSQETFEKNGISEESFKKVLTSSYKSDAIFMHYYGVDGEEGVTEDELYDYYKEHNIRCQYLNISLTDSEGNLLKSGGKAEMKTLIEGYRDRVQDAYDAGGAAAVMTEMDAVKADYDAYVAAQAEESAAEEEAENAESADEETTAVTEAETVAEETVEEETTAEEETAADESAAAEDADGSLTGEVSFFQTLTAHAEDAADEAEETTEAAEVVEDETDAAADDEAAPADAETEVVSDEDETLAADADSADEETPEEAETSDEEAEETDTDSDLDIGGEEDGVSVEDVDDAELLYDEEEETTPYANESIISVINPDDYDNPEDIYYNPSEKAYNQLLDIAEADYGVPYIVEEDEHYYLIVRYDITERMTEDDLWTESAVNNVVYTAYSDAFEELMDTWTANMNASRNAAAYKRYDPFKLDFS